MKSLLDFCDGFNKEELELDLYIPYEFSKISKAIKLKRKVKIERNVVEWKSKKLKEKHKIVYDVVIIDYFDDNYFLNIQSFDKLQEAKEFVEWLKFLGEKNKENLWFDEHRYFWKFRINNGYFELLEKVI